MNEQINWIEVWIHTNIMYILLLQGYKNGSIKLYDPQQRQVSQSSFESYEEAYFWLREDEYDLVEGRMEINN